MAQALKLAGECACDRRSRESTVKVVVLCERKVAAAAVDAACGVGGEHIGAGVVDDGVTQDRACAQLRGEQPSTCACKVDRSCELGVVGTEAAKVVVARGCACAVHQADRAASWHIDRVVDVDVVVGGEREFFVARPRHRIVDVDVATGARGARAAQNGDVVAGEVGTQSGARDIAASAHGEVCGINGPAATRAFGRFGRNSGAIGNTHMGTGGFNLSTIAPKFCALCTQGAVDVNGAAGVGQVCNEGDLPAAASTTGHGIGGDGAGVADAVAGHQANHTPVIDQTIGLDGARVFDHTALYGVGRLGRQNHQSARCHHGVAVLNVGSHGGWRHQDIGQCLVGFKLQLEGFASCQNNGAALGNHNPLVLNFRRQQGDVATQLGGEGALVENFSCGSCATEAVVARHEVGVADAVGGGHQAAHIHAGARREIHPIGVL